MSTGPARNVIWDKLHRQSQCPLQASYYLGNEFWRKKCFVLGDTFKQTKTDLNWILVVVLVRYLKATFECLEVELYCSVGCLWSCFHWRIWRKSCALISKITKSDWCSCSQYLVEDSNNLFTCFCLFLLITHISYFLFRSVQEPKTKTTVSKNLSSLVVQQGV